MVISWVIWEYSEKGAARYQPTVFSCSFIYFDAPSMGWSLKDANLILVLKIWIKVCCSILNFLFHPQISFHCVVVKVKFEISNLIKCIIENIILVLDYISNKKIRIYWCGTCPLCSYFNKIYTFVWNPNSLKHWFWIFIEFPTTKFTQNSITPIP